MMRLVNWIRAALLRLRTKLKVVSSGSITSFGFDSHIGSGCRFWAPSGITIGRGSYIGHKVTIECNCEIGNFVLIANNVAIVGRRDHDFRALGYPMRFAPWVGLSTNPAVLAAAIIEDDVWLGFGAILLSGVRIGRGSVIAAGSVVSRDVPPYSIVAGNPSVVVGCRFTPDQRVQHERAVSSGFFRYGGFSPSFWIVRPGGSNDED